MSYARCRPQTAYRVIGRTDVSCGRDLGNRGLCQMRVAPHLPRAPTRDAPACHAIGTVYSDSYLAPPGPSWLRNSVIRVTCTSNPRSGIQASSHE